jgi:hypothetical protein
MREISRCTLVVAGFLLTNATERCIPKEGWLLIEQ